MNKPGVMFYFEIRPCLERLTLKEKGILFEAILDYGEYGTEPELKGKPGVAWDFLRPRLDRDNARYFRQLEQRQYAAYSKNAKKNQQIPLSLSEWRTESENEMQRPVTNDNETQRTLTDDNETQRTLTNSNQTTNSIPHTSDSIPQTNKSVCDTGADRPRTPARFIPPTAAQVQEYCQSKQLNVDAQRFVDYYTSNGWRVGKNPMKDWQAAARHWNGKENAHGKTESIPLGSIGITV